MRTIMNQVTKKAFIYIVVLGFKIFTAQTYVFGTAGATGNFGPTQADLDLAYASSNLNGMVTSTNGVQTWTVPQTGIYHVTVIGAAGGGLPPVKFGGKGALMSGDLNFTAGTVLKILVGQQGSNAAGCFGGGGGSFLSDNGNTPLIIAGGGGGAGGTMGGNGVDASIGQNGTAGVAGGAGGTNGNGGVAANTNGGSGGGFFTDGGGNFYMPECSTSVGQAFVNGGAGGQFDFWEPGGFGGGGSAWWGNGNGGGGGGYSGGGTSGSYFFGGGGGGSFNSGINQNNQQSYCVGDGTITITLLKLLQVDVAPEGGLLGTGTLGTPTVSVSTFAPEQNANETGSWSIYPNPSSGVVNIRTEKNTPTSRLKVFSSIGELVYEKKVNPENEPVDLSMLRPGLYYLSLNDSKVQKLIID
jgi:hypothetical protein